jgi:hypothetical protein
MGLGNFASDDEESSSGNKSTYVTWKNPTKADISEGSEHRHKQDYYDAVKDIRGRLGQDINVLFGEFAVAANEADNGNPEHLEELFNDLTSDE